MLTIVTLLLSTFFVYGRNGPDTVIAERAQDFGNGFLVGTHAADGVVQFFSVKLRKGRHQSDNGVFEVSTEFAFQIVDQILNTKENGISIVTTFLPTETVDYICHGKYCTIVIVVHQIEVQVQDTKD